MEVKYNIEKEKKKALQQRVIELEENNLIYYKQKVELSKVCTEQNKKILELKTVRGGLEAAKVKKEPKTETNNLVGLQNKIGEMIVNKAKVEAEVNSLNVCIKLYEDRVDNRTSTNSPITEIHKSSNKQQQQTRKFWLEGYWKCANLCY